jgi:dTDP-4-dehydrorhamnose 3,5-epimerase-like enzyme
VEVAFIAPSSNACTSSYSIVILETEHPQLYMYESGWLEGMFAYENMWCIIHRIDQLFQNEANGFLIYNDNGLGNAGWILTQAIAGKQGNSMYNQENRLQGYTC